MLKDFSKQVSEIALLIIFYGAFNPLIFDKYWFAKNKLIGEVEAENLEVEFLHEKGVSLRFDYCDFRSDNERIIFKIDQTAFLTQTIDLVKGFLLSLKTIPIGGAEFDIYPHFDLREEDEVDKFFNVLSPKPFWDNLLADTKIDNIELKQKRKEKYSHGLNIEISKCPKSEKLIHIYLRDIYLYKDENLSAKEINEFIDKELEKSFNHSIDTINKLINVS